MVRIESENSSSFLSSIGNNVVSTHNAIFKQSYFFSGKKVFAGWFLLRHTSRKG